MKKTVVLCYSFILFCFLTSSLFSPSMAQINALTKSLKNNQISQGNTSTSNEAELKSPCLNVLSKSTNKVNYQKQISNNLPKEIRQFDSPIYYKPVKVKFQNSFKDIMVPFIDKKYMKITKKATTKSKNKIALLRIGEKGTPDLYPIPMPVDSFKLPKETKEDLDGYDKLVKMQNLIENLTVENYSQSASDIFSLSFDISYNYNQRSDLSALALLYQKDFLMKYAKITGTFSSLYSSSYEYEYYNQLCQEYEDRSKQNKTLSILMIVAKNRLVEFIMNNEALKARNSAIDVEISQLKDKIAKRTSEIENTPFYPESYLYSLSSEIPNLYSKIHQLLTEKYSNYYKMGDYSNANKIIDVNNENGTALLTGELYDNFKAVPAKLFVNIKYDNGEIKKVPITQLRDTYTFLSNVSKAQLLQNYNPANDSLDQNANSLQSKKTILFGDYIKSFEPSSGNENDPKDNISTGTLNYLKSSAYGYNNSYLNIKPDIVSLYFSLNGQRHIDLAISEPNNSLTLKSKQKNTTNRNYAFKVNIESLRSMRKKEVTLKYDFIDWAFYAVFKPNETADTSDVSVNVIDNAKNSFGGKSICCYDAELFTPQLYDIYTNVFFYPDDKNKYFKTLGYAYWRKKYNNPKPKNSITTLPNQENEIPHQSDLTFYNNGLIDPSVDFIKSAGIEYIRAKYENCADYVAIKNPANWFIVDTHGWERAIYEDKEPNGGLIEAEYNITEGGADENKIILGVAPYDLIDKDGNSLYSENLEVLIMPICGSLAWKGDCASSNPKDWIFAHGWHKVLPHGLILGYKTEPVNSMVERIFEKLKSNLIDKKTSKTDLAKTWISVNETMFLDSFNGTKKTEKYKSAEGCVIISNKLYLDGNMQYDEGTQKFNFVPLIKVFKN